MKLIREAEEEAALLVARAAGQWAEWEADGDEHRYTDPVIISDDPAFKNRVVRLDRVILALHMISARHAFHTTPELMLLLVEKISGFMEGLIVASAAKRLANLRTSGNVVLKVIAQVLGFMDDALLQKRLEFTIRANSLRARQDLAQLNFSSGKAHPRKRSLVFTRIWR